MATEIRSGGNHSGGITESLLDELAALRKYQRHRDFIKWQQKYEPDLTTMYSRLSSWIQKKVLYDDFCEYVYKNTSLQLDKHTHSLVHP